jgi:hypothetical protein
MPTRRRKKPHRQNKPVQGTRASSARPEPSAKSSVKAFRTWMITAIVAGFAATITGAVVSFSHATVTQVARDLHLIDSTVSVNVSVGGPQLAVQIAQGFATCDGGDGWVFPRSAAAAYDASPAKGPTRNGQTWLSDPSAWGAVEASDVQIQMVVSSNSPRAIVLTGIRAHVFRRRPALQGTVVDVMPEPCAAPTVQIGTIDLDTAPPSWVYPGTPTGMAEGDNTAPVKFPYIVSESNPEPFVLTITTQHCDCTWDLELLWASGTTNGESIINDNGKPFETTAAAHLPSITWSNQTNDGSWQMLR